jgi:tyrosyl-tRNA synthetase
MEAKKRLAFEVVSGYYGGDIAQKEAEQFEKVFSARQLPDEMRQITVKAASLEHGKIWSVKLVVDSGFAPSNSEARRLISQGAVTLDGQKVENPETAVGLKDDMVLKVGKRRFGRIKIVE